MGKRANADFPFLSRLDELLKELCENVPAALKEFDPEAVHEARVATRRLKAALDLLKSVLSDAHRKPFAKALRKLRRRLGPLRDADVMIEHLGELSAQSAPAADWLKERLIESRDKARAKSRKNSQSAEVLARLGSWWGVREEVFEAQEAVDSLLAESLHLQLDAFAERARELTVEADTAQSSGEREDPHQLRIAGKRLRYTLELAAVHGHELPPAVMRAFKKMQEALGDWHDYVVLVECAMRMSLQAQLSYHHPGMQEQLLELTRTLLRRAVRELDGFARLWRQSGDEVARTIREKFPLTHPAPISAATVSAAPISEPQTDPGPNGSDAPPAPAAPPPDVASTA